MVVWDAAKGRLAGQSTAFCPVSARRLCLSSPPTTIRCQESDVQQLGSGTFQAHPLSCHSTSISCRLGCLGLAAWNPRAPHPSPIKQPFPVPIRVVALRKALEDSPHTWSRVFWNIQNAPASGMQYGTRPAETELPGGLKIAPAYQYCSKVSCKCSLTCTYKFT